MKKISIFVIPVIVVIILLGGAFIWKMMTPASPTVVTGDGPMPNSVSDAEGAKPANPFGFLFGSKATVAPTPATAAEMNAQLDALDNDDGTSDINSLKSDASGL